MTEVSSRWWADWLSTSREIRKTERVLVWGRRWHRWLWHGGFNIFSNRKVGHEVWNLEKSPGWIYRVEKARISWPQVTSISALACLSSTGSSNCWFPPCRPSPIQLSLEQDISSVPTSSGVGVWLDWPILPLSTAYPSSTLCPGFWACPVRSACSILCSPHPWNVEPIRELPSTLILLGSENCLHHSN